MIIFTCKITGDEMLTDAYKVEDVTDDEGNVVPGLMEIESQIVAKAGGDIDIGAGNAFGGGGEDEPVDDNVEKVNNVIDETMGFGYQVCDMKKKVRSEKARSEVTKRHCTAIFRILPLLRSYTFEQLQLLLRLTQLLASLVAVTLVVTSL